MLLITVVVLVLTQHLLVGTIFGIMAFVSGCCSGYNPMDFHEAGKDYLKLWRR